MTREEAVEVLKERYLTCVGIGLDNHANRVNEAIDMAIEALQTEVVRCKNCIHRQTDKCPMYHEEWRAVDEGDGYIDEDLVIFDWTVDDGYCHLGDTRGGDDE